MSKPNRPLTGLETYYARTVYVRLILLKWVLLVLGILLTLLGIGLPVAFVVDDMRISPLMMMFLFALALVIFALGLFITAHGLWRQMTLSPTTTQLRGTLIEKRRTAVSPNTGSRSTHYEYYIDAIRICWPPNSEGIYRPLVGQYVALSVAMIDISSLQKLKTLLARLNKRLLGQDIDGVGIVLNHQGTINIHGVLAKYGRHYLLIHQLQWALSFCLFAALTLYIAMQPFMVTFIARTNVLLVLLAMVLYLLGVCTAGYFIFKGYQKIRKWLDPRYDDTPHEERLRG
ncbi:hypothetical protein [Halomonas dongshanensis]|uniref:Uncharacterized protein n=1 Tax=Halomonas dongshanensis TaxID=2890835 RepID=A0ABT2EA97_9GAMM|nr:hypothetical protein [Halomonas dongshanensis]MCS2608504.1 hypothetical protein [Halomonas dongshanensis]